MTTEACQSHRGFLVQHRRVLYVRLRVCSPCHCSATTLPLTCSSQCTNPHCRTEQAWLCILIRDRQRARGTRQDAVTRRRKQRSTSLSPSPPPPALHDFTSAMSLSSHPGRAGNSFSVDTKGFSFPGFPLLREEEEVGGGQAGGAAKAHSSVMMAVLTASKNGHRIDGSSGSGIKHCAG